MASMLAALVKCGVTTKVHVAKLADFASAWSAQLPTDTRLVFKP